MFGLTEDDLEKGVLGCGDGPASFNATMYRQGGQVVSADPLYQFTADQIRSRVEEAYRTIMEQLRANLSAYVWTIIKSPEHLGQIRLEAMGEFLADYDQGKAEGRYQPHELPQLPFDDRKFDLALCSHLLFTYSGQLSQAFHCEAVLEMCRVATEVRIFPVLDMAGRLSPHLPAVCRYLGQHGLQHEVSKVDYEFQRGGNEMLRVWREADPCP